MKKKTLWGLEKNSYPKNKRWAVDQDYVSTLDSEAKEWLNQFNEEYYKDKFVKNKQPLHNTKELQKECHDRGNRARRDTYGVVESMKMLDLDPVKTDEDGNTVYLLDQVPDLPGIEG